ncbi:MAG: hypothetical protein A4E20_13720 [Nitrospira sp. SG-bin2]|jgi:hypothetical protein|uniref:hypothetical protein n=1 Tax=Nitrospira cf. moscoviensis SBR1015 TaxID=96242 RepID=UPI000A0AD95D|nr:hypothetical protein [Nitrospira cf. moscoviensis SBR1015]OQW32518.1 MAG: hypothetical protein A4E20_13720 [Nitrospira sp. SG-bin2]
MASFTYNDFRVVLRRAGFEHLRSEKHETWRKFLPNGSILRVRISHQHKRDILKWLVHEMLRQARLILGEFSTGAFGSTT